MTQLGRVEFGAADFDLLAGYQHRQRIAVVDGLHLADELASRRGAGGYAEDDTKEGGRAPFVLRVDAAQMRVDERRGEAGIVLRQGVEICLGEHPSAGDQRADHPAQAVGARRIRAGPKEGSRDGERIAHVGRLSRLALDLQEESGGVHRSVKRVDQAWVIVLRRV